MKEWITLIAAVIGAVGGVVSLVVVIFSVGRRVGQLETDVQALKQDSIDQKEWGELRHKVTTLYGIYIEHVVKQNVPPAVDRRERGPKS